MSQTIPMPSPQYFSLLNHAHTRLQQLNLQDWFIVIRNWFANYDGWVSFYNCDNPLMIDDAPYEQLIVILDQLARQPHRPNDLSLSAALSQIDCLTWRAAANGQSWDSRQTPFSTLLQAEADEVEVWQYNTPFPEPNVVQHWLLNQIKQVRGGLRA